MHVFKLLVQVRDWTRNYSCYKKARTVLYIQVPYYRTCTQGPTNANHLRSSANAPPFIKCGGGNVWKVLTSKVLHSIRSRFISLSVYYEYIKPGQWSNPMFKQSTNNCNSLSLSNFITATRPRDVFFSRSLNDAVSIRQCSVDMELLINVAQIVECELPRETLALGETPP
jgi:hypothetical protein